MKLRRIMAGTLAATMIVGSSITVFADDAQTGTATGSGTSVGHIDKEVTTVTLPTDSSVANIFNYHVDPERVIDLAGKLKDDTSVTKNEDGVYFKNTDGYSSSSDAVEFEGKNSVAVDVSVKAEVTASAGGKDITLVADDSALAAATTPALLMNLKVGSETKAITSATEGTTAKAKLEGVPDNFEVGVESNAYKYAAKTGATGWKKTTVQLSGKTNKMDVAADMTAPSIKLTWTIAKSVLSTSEISAANNSVTLNLPASTTLSKIELAYADGSGAIALSEGSQYTVSGTTYTFSANDIPAWLGMNPAYSKLIFTFSDNTSESINIVAASAATD